MSWLSWLLLFLLVLILVSPFLISFILQKALKGAHFKITPRGYFTYAKIALFASLGPVSAFFMRLAKCKCRVRLGRRKALGITLENLELILFLDGNNEKYQKDEGFLRELYNYGE